MGRQSLLISWGSLYVAASLAAEQLTRRQDGRRCGLNGCVGAPDDLAAALVATAAASPLVVAGVTANDQYLVALACQDTEEISRHLSTVDFIHYKGLIVLFDIGGRGIGDLQLLFHLPVIVGRVAGAYDLSLPWERS